MALYDTRGEAFKFWFSRFWTKTRQYDNAKVMTPLRLAALSDHDRVLEHFLAEVGNDMEAKDEAGRTALYWASELGHGRVVDILLNKGADVNAQGGYDGSALQAASVRGHDKIVQILLANGADVNAVGGYYGSALQAASAGGHDKIVQILLDKGADANARGESTAVLYRQVHLEATSKLSICYCLGVPISNMRQRMELHCMRPCYLGVM